MITLMQKVQGFFAKREQLTYSLRVIKVLRKSKKFMKKLKPVIVTRAFPDGTEETTELKLYKGRFVIPQEYIMEQKKGTLQLVDGSTI